MDSQPPPVTRTKGVRRNAKRTYQPETMEKRETNDFEAQNSQPPASPPCPPLPTTRTRGVRRNAKLEGNDSVVKSSPPPPPPPPPLPEEVRTVPGKKERGSATKESLISLRGKKKKQRQRSVENFDSILSSESLFSQPPPPRPPPPPPPKVFQNLFSLKKGKHKNRHIVCVATITRASVSNKREHGSSSNVMMAGNESPLNPIPPPPPLPPFKLPGWKFRVQGDFVRVDRLVVHVVDHLMIWMKLVWTHQQLVLMMKQEAKSIVLLPKMVKILQV
ncbi:hypothetical protein JHK87_043831 [Glycine soja]|nr:hypothetical protein JHK87_043831 [Glycine soja]